MERVFGRPIVTQEQMRTRIRELGKQISVDYAGKDLVLVGVLKGAYAFYADLARAIRIPIHIDFIVVSSYGGKSKTSGKEKLLTDLTEPIKGKDVLLVEDIVDSGLTLAYLRKNLLARNPASLEVCALVLKEGLQRTDPDLRYVGFALPPSFVIGYGLDVAERYRNLPFIAEYAGPTEENP